MDDLSLQQYYRLQIEEKHRIDEYSVFFYVFVLTLNYKFVNIELQNVETC